MNTSIVTRSWRCLLIVTLLSLVACSTTMQAKTASAPGADFKTMKTFAWLEEPGKVVGASGNARSPVLAAKIRSETEQALQAKGYRKTDRNDADFLLGYHVILSRQTDIQVVNRHYQYGPGWGGRYSRPGLYRNLRPDAVAFHYDYGTLIIDAVEPEKRDLLWRGYVTDTVTLDSAMEQKLLKIEQAVGTIFSGFPN